MRKSIKMTLFAGGAILAAGGAQACGEVSITEMDWGSSIVVTNVAKFLMEKGYGCTVETVPSSTVPAVTSLAETGEPDIVTELWLNGAVGLQKLLDEGKVEQTAWILSDGGVEGWWIPKYLADEHPELTEIDAILADPAAVGGVFNSCPEGWGCQVSNEFYSKAYDFEGHGMEFFQHGSGETLATSIAAAYENQEPWFGYYWAPTSVLGKYPMVLVDQGPADEAIHACASDKDCNDYAKSGWPASPVATIVVGDLKDREPEVYELMKNVSFSNEQMNSVLAWQEDNNATGEEAAVYFLTNYQDVWSGWINDAAKENLAAILN